jgi:hypothetical protein
VARDDQRFEPAEPRLIGGGCSCATTFRTRAPSPKMIPVEVHGRRLWRAGGGGGRWISFGSWCIVLRLRQAVHDVWVTVNFTLVPMMYNKPVEVQGRPPWYSVARRRKKISLGSRLFRSSSVKTGQRQVGMLRLATAVVIHLVVIINL